LGWNGKDFEGLLDLGKEEEIKKINLRFYKAPFQLDLHAIIDKNFGF